MKLLEATRRAIALAKPTKNERILVLSDKRKKAIAELFFKAAIKRNKGMLVIIPELKHHREEPGKLVEQIMLEADIIYCITHYSLTWTNAIGKARKKGCRIASLPGITKCMLIRGMKANYLQIKKRCSRVEKKLKKAKKIFVIAKGTRLEVFRGNRPISKQDSDLSHKRTLHNIPGGEIGFSPLEMQGYFTARDYHVNIGRSTKFIVRDGEVEVIGNTALKKALYSYKGARKIAEFSLGMNPGVRLSRSILEAEKKLGTCHIGLGEARGLGGKNRSEIHWDFVINKPTIFFDDKIFMKDGVIV